MTEFDDIRPYNDEEVRPTLDRILADPELAKAITRLKFPRTHQAFAWALQPLVRRVLKSSLHMSTRSWIFSRLSKNIWRQ